MKHDVLVPLDDLLEVVLVSAVAGEGVGEEQSTKGVTALISTVRVHLSSRVVGLCEERVRE